MSIDPRGRRRLSRRADERRRDGRARRRLALVTDQWLAELSDGQVVPLRPATRGAAGQHKGSEYGTSEPSTSPVA